MLAQVKEAWEQRPWAAFSLKVGTTLAMAWMAFSMAFPAIALAAEEGEEEAGEEGGSILDAIGSVFDTITNPGEAIMNIIVDLIVGLLVNMYNAAVGTVRQIDANMLNHEFNDLFGNGTSSVYDFVVAVNDSFVTSIGYTFLAIVMLVKLANLGQRMDGNGTLPAVKEVFLLVVWYAVLLFLINNSLEICSAVYSMGLALSNMVDAAVPDSAAYQFAELAEDDLSAFMTLEGLLMLLVWMIIFYLASGITVLVAHFVVWGRALQIYAYAAFAPIALPFLGLDETKQWAMGFIKNFVALCLTGAFIVFILLIYPHVMAIAFTDLPLNDPVLTVLDNRLELLMWLVKSLAFYCVLIYALVKTGSWARELLGG